MREGDDGLNEEREIYEAILQGISDVANSITTVVGALRGHLGGKDIEDVHGSKEQNQGETE